MIFEESAEFISSQLFKLFPPLNRMVKTISVRINPEMAFKGADRLKMLSQNGLSPIEIIRHINSFH